MKKVRITIELPLELAQLLHAYAAAHHDGNVSAAIRAMLRRFLK